jgi:lipopolysaccharide biosynthesis protein
MIHFLHTYYPPADHFKNLNFDQLYWSHTGSWKNDWDNSFPCEKRYHTNNIGKDLGGKLFLFQVLLENTISDDYIIFLHDKNSPQVINGKQWKEELWSIAEQQKIKEAITILDQNKTIGIVANKVAIIDPDKAGETYAYATNKAIIFEEAKKYDILPVNKSFVAGTMFIARLEPYIHFFKENNPLEIRANMEQGNVLDLEEGTLTHSWERLLSWIVTSKNYTIAGI